MYVCAIISPLQADDPPRLVGAPPDLVAERVRAAAAGVPGGGGGGGGGGNVDALWAAYDVCGVVGFYAPRGAGTFAFRTFVAGGDTLERAETLATSQPLDVRVDLAPQRDFFGALRFVGETLRDSLREFEQACAPPKPANGAGRGGRGGGARGGRGARGGGGRDVGGGRGGGGNNSEPPPALGVPPRGIDTGALQQLEALLLFAFYMPCPVGGTMFTRGSQW